jgi:precorrin-2 dehydrogenase/sirohydrochlorin ferrochelatase
MKYDMGVVKDEPSSNEPFTTSRTPFRSPGTAMPLFPLFLNLHGQRCLVVGGGSVGRRKALALLAAGAKVRLVCLERMNFDALSIDMETLQRLEWIVDPYRPDYLSGCVLVCAAATPEVNEKVVANAQAHGICVNSATEPESGTVLFPASASTGSIQIAVSTGGASPIVARRIATMLAESCDEALLRWVDLLGEMRAYIRETIDTEDQRRALLKQLAEPEWLARLRHEDTKVVRDAMRALVKKASKR